MPRWFVRFWQALWLPMILLAMSLACVIPANRASDTPTPAAEAASVPVGGEPVVSLGDSVTGSDWRFTVTQVERQPSVAWSSLGNVAEVQGVYAVVQVRVENVSSDAALLRAADLQVRDGVGHAYSADERISVYYSAFHRLSKPEGTYPPRRPVEVGLVYDVPQDAHGLQLYVVQARTSIALDP